MTAPSSVLVVGASVGGLSVVEALRREKYEGKVTLLGAERHPPYDRPPLSKKVLAGALEPERTQLRTAAALAQLGAELILGDAAVRLDAAAREVVTASGRCLRADALVLATGVVPRLLPGQEPCAGVHVLRTVDDAIALRADLLAASKVVIVGDGVLGTEIAASARGLGLQVTLVGPQRAPLENHLGPLAADQLTRLHSEQGVALRLGVAVEGLVPSGGRVRAVRLASGEELGADVVVVAIGARPSLDWLRGSGLQLGDGIICDSRCRAAEGIYAVGDVACFHHEGLGAGVRLENRSNAVEQGMAVAANILGKDRPYVPIPFFWTDQYETKIQLHGFLPTRPDETEVAIVEGDPAQGAFVALYGRSGKAVAVLGWNMMKQARMHRAHVAAQAAFADAVAAVRGAALAG